jgi:putative aldouronate transport system substrate-binding protein
MHFTIKKLEEDFMKSISKLWKKALAMGLVTTMVLTSGCGSTSTSTVVEGDEVASTTESTTSTDSGMTTISVYRPCFNLASSDEAEVQAVQDAINAYIADKIGVQVELHEISSGEYSDKCNLAIAASEVDLFFTANWMQTIKTDDVVRQNAVYDITSLLADSDLYAALPDWVWTASAFDGKNYFVPCYKESAEGYNLMFRTELVEKYGWDISSVSSLTDLESILADCLAEGLKYPFLTQKTAAFNRIYLDKYDFFSSDSFIAVDKETDEVVDTVTSDAYAEFATIMGDWAVKGYVSEDDITKTTADTTTQTQDWGVALWTDVPNNDEADTRYGQSVEMAKITKNWVMSNTTLGSCFAICANSPQEKAEAAIKFLGLLYTDNTLADLFTYGIEGVDYTKEADGTVTKTDAKLYDHSAWESTSVEIVSLVTGEPANKIELYSTFNDTSVSSVAAGFRFDKTNVDAEYSACVQVFNEYGFILENGGFAPADVPDAIQAYQQALDDAGYQKILEEAQKQYEEWKTTR